MSAIEIQGFLNKLYLEEDFRNDFFKDRQLFFKSRSIHSPETIAFMKDINQGQVEFFSQGLYKKRKYAVDQLLPRTVKILGENHKTLFRKFSKTFFPDGIHKHHSDAIHYCDFINRQGKKSILFKNILKFEKDLLKNFLRPRYFYFSVYYYNPVTTLESPDLSDITAPSRSLTLITWRKGIIKNVMPFG